MISHDRRFLSNLSRSTVWLDRGETRRVERGFADFESWRDEVLEEEERNQHKLDRKIVAEEHWLRYGVSGRRKRNVKRLATLHSLREARRTHRGAGRQARTSRRAKRTDPACSSSRPRASARPTTAGRSSAISRPASCAATASASSARTAAARPR